MAVPPDAALYINRELSLLAFFQRVMEEAQDEANPLLERVKFLSIFASNLADNVKARQMRPDGTYERVRPEAGQPAVNSQAVLLDTKNPIV